VILRDYQEAAVCSIFEYFASGKTGNPIVAMPTGTGKSIVLGEFIKRALQTYPGTRVMKLTHVKELVSQNLDKLLQLWPEAPAGVYSAGLKRKEQGCPITFGGVASVAKASPSIFGRIDLLLIDECHLVSQKETTMYRVIIDVLKSINPSLKVIGFTATHYRLGHGMLTESGGIFTDVCFDLTRMDAFNWFIDQGYLATLIPRTTAAEFDLSEVHIHGGEYKQDELQAAVDKSEITYAACQELRQWGHDREHWLLFASGIEHAEHVANCLQSMGVAATFVHSKMSADLRDSRIAEFVAGKYRAMINNGILCLDSETQILTKKGWVGMEEMSYSHHIASYHLTGQITFNHPKFIVKRNLLPNEQFVVGEGRTMGYRVTDNHRMLVKFQNSKSWKVVAAKELIGNRRYRYPISGNFVPEMSIELSSDECSFIGFWLGDGTLYKRKPSSGYGWECSLTQSNAYPVIVQWVDKLLNRLGILHSRHSFKHSHGTAIRWNLNCSSWRKYTDWLNKAGSEKLFELTEEQFAAMLRGFWLADGNHYSGENVSSEGWAVTGTQKELYDKLQAVGVSRGYRISITEKRPPLAGTHKQQYTLRWKKAAEASLTEINKPYAERLSTDLKTWCVTSDTGFIVTRRKGRVTVVGNTTGFDFPGIDLIGMLRATLSPGLWVQMLGRGTRPVYASGFDLSTVEGRHAAIKNGPKQNCLVLDFAGNTRRLGPINDPVLPRKKGKGKGQAPVKVCEVCGTYNHASVRFCAGCAAEFPKHLKISEQAGTDELIATQEVKTAIFKVDRVTYSKHHKQDFPDSIQVSYYCGLRMFKEWVCLEHNGFASKKARDWWRERSIGYPPPDTTAEAMELIDSLKEPIHIRVWLKSKYDDILGYDFTGNGFGETE